MKFSITDNRSWQVQVFSGMRKAINIVMTCVFALIFFTGLYHTTINILMLDAWLQHAVGIISLFFSIVLGWSIFQKATKERINV